MITFTFRTNANDFATDASGCRNQEDFLFATDATAVVPGFRRVELQWESDDGYRASA